MGSACNAATSFPTASAARVVIRCDACATPSMPDVAPTGSLAAHWHVTTRSLSERLRVQTRSASTRLFSTASN